MELDDLKEAVRHLDRRIEEQNRLNIEGLGERQLNRTYASLRPLFWGHIGQVGLGLLLSLLSAPLWVRNLDKTHLLISALMLNVYSVLMIALGARMLWLLYSLDFAAPVISIQKQLERLRGSYVGSGLAVGLPWWLLWIPCAILFLRIDLQSSQSAWIAVSAAFGVAGILATLWFCRGSFRMPPAGSDDPLGGPSLQRARRFLHEIEQFERE